MGKRKIEDGKWKSEKRKAKSEKRKAKSEKRKAKSEKRKAKSEKRKAKSEKRKARRHTWVSLDLRSFGPGRLGPQDDRLVSGARAEKRRQGAALHERRPQEKSDPKRKANPRPTLTKRGWGTRKPVRNPRAQSGVTVQQKRTQEKSARFGKRPLQGEGKSQNGPPQKAAPTRERETQEPT